MCHRKLKLAVWRIFVHLKLNFWYKNRFFASKLTWNIAMIFYLHGWPGFLRFFWRISNLVFWGKIFFCDISRLEGMFNIRNWYRIRRSSVAVEWYCWNEPEKVRKISAMNYYRFSLFFLFFLSEFLLDHPRDPW